MGLEVANSLARAQIGVAVAKVALVAVDAHTGVDLQHTRAEIEGNERAAMFVSKRIMLWFKHAKYKQMGILQAVWQPFRTQFNSASLEQRVWLG